MEKPTHEEQRRASLDQQRVRDDDARKAALDQLSADMERHMARSMPDTSARAIAQAVMLALVRVGVLGLVLTLALPGRAAAETYVCTDGNGCSASRVEDGEFVWHQFRKGDWANTKSGWMVDPQDGWEKVVVPLAAATVPVPTPRWGAQVALAVGLTGTLLVLARARAVLILSRISRPRTPGGEGPRVPSTLSFSRKTCGPGAGQ